MLLMGRSMNQYKTDNNPKRKFRVSTLGGLQLTLHPGDGISIGGNLITIEYVGHIGSAVRVGVVAPKDMRISRVSCEAIVRERENPKCSMCTVSLCVCAKPS